MVSAATGYDGDIIFEKNVADGPIRRTADTSVFEKICPDFKYSPLETSIHTTVAWYRSQFNKVS